MKFEVDISKVIIQEGASVNTQPLGTWTAGLNSELKIKNEDEMKNMTADVVYRIYTVAVRHFLVL